MVRQILTSTHATTSHEGCLLVCVESSVQQINTHGEQPKAMLCAAPVACVFSNMAGAIVCCCKCVYVLKLCVCAEWGACLLCVQQQAAEISLMTCGPSDVISHPHLTSAYGPVCNVSICALTCLLHVQQQWYQAASPVCHTCIQLAQGVVTGHTRNETTQ